MIRKRISDQTDYIALVEGNLMVFWVFQEGFKGYHKGIYVALREGHEKARYKVESSDDVPSFFSYLTQPKYFVLSNAGLEKTLINDGNKNLGYYRGDQIEGFECHYHLSGSDWYWIWCTPKDKPLMPLETHLIFNGRVTTDEDYTVVAEIFVWKLETSFEETSFGKIATMNLKLTGYWINNGLRREGITLKSLEDDVLWGWREFEVYKRELSTLREEAVREILEQRKRCQEEG